MDYRRDDWRIESGPTHSTLTFDSGVIVTVWVGSADWRITGPRLDSDLKDMAAIQAIIEKEFEGYL